jgi:hypothetical protein
MLSPISKLSALAAIMMAASLAAGPALAQTTLPPTVQGLRDDEALRLLGEALGRSVQATQTDPTIPEILEALDRNIAATRRIRELAEATPVLTEEQMQQIGREISGIAQSFQEIADLAPGVFARRWAEISNLEAIGTAVSFRIGDARARLEGLRTDNQRIQNELVNAQLSRADIEKRRLTQQANNAEIQSLDAALSAWGFFADRHAEVIARMGDQSENLDIFFHALRENARVYNAAAQTLNLANSLRTALADLERIEMLDLMRSQLVESWGDLMRIIGEVNNGLILQPGV